VNGTRKCSVDDCDTKHKARGLCNTHYARLISSESKRPGFQKTGVDTWKRASKPLEERLQERMTVTSDGCWEWTGAVTEHGYGRMSWGNHVERTHRLAAHLWLGFDLNPKVVVRHRCDNPPCLNPEHLETGTQLNNVQDMVSRGRANGGPAFQSECKSGHPFTDANVKLDKKGQRRCRECANETARKYRSRRTEREGAYWRNHPSRTNSTTDQKAKERSDDY
jgi:hypothetical protein